MWARGWGAGGGKHEVKVEGVRRGEQTEDAVSWFGEKARRRRGKGDGGETFYSWLRQPSPAYEKCMEHQSETQLFAWLRGLERRMQLSLTHEHSGRSRGTIEAAEQQEDGPGGETRREEKGE